MDLGCDHGSMNRSLFGTMEPQNKCRIAGSGPGGSSSGGGAGGAEDICLVCQDASTGYHYGVPSCNGWCVACIVGVMFTKRRLLENGLEGWCVSQDEVCSICAVV